MSTPMTCFCCSCKAAAVGESGVSKTTAEIAGAPLKLLRRFKASHEWLLEAGDMLYLPPGWGHDGVAVGECMTASVGFRSPRADELAHALLVGIADAVADAREESVLYGDRASAATATPALIPPAMASFARATWQRATRDPQTLQRALGQWLSEPKARVWVRVEPTSACAWHPHARAGPPHPHAL